MTAASDQAMLEARVSADLVQRIGRGDHEAERAMIERYGRGLLYLLHRRTRDPELAKDLRQETFIIAIEKLRAEPLHDPERLAAFLRGVALNLLSSEWRKTKRRATVPDLEAIESAAEAAPGPGDDLSRVQAARAVRLLLEELSVARDRELLIRLYLQDQDRDAICSALGIDGSHFNRVLFRAKQRFRALLAQAERRRKLEVVR